MCVNEDFRSFSFNFRQPLQRKTLIWLRKMSLHSVHYTYITGSPLCVSRLLSGIVVWPKSLQSEHSSVKWVYVTFSIRSHKFLSPKIHNIHSYNSQFLLLNHNNNVELEITLTVVFKSLLFLSESLPCWKRWFAGMSSLAKLVLSWLSQSDQPLNQAYPRSGNFKPF